MSKKTYHGSCHCKKTRFEADIDLSKGTGRCNCTFCRKVRNWSAIVKPEDFRFNSDEKEAGSYRFNEKSPNQHLFCKNCGVRVASRGFVEEIGGHYVSVVLAVLDDVKPEELIAAPIQYFDGLHDNWFQQPEEVRHL